MSILSTIEQDAAALAAALAPAPPPFPAAPPAPTAMSAAPLTAADFAAGLSAARTILNALSANASTLTTAQVVAEDVAGLLADFDFPGAAIADQVITNVPALIAQAQALLPTLSAGLALVGSSSVFDAAPNMHPVGEAGSKPTGIV